MPVPQIVIKSETSYIAYPQVILKIDTIDIKLDSISAKKINPKWIKKIEIIRNEEFNFIYGNKDGVIFIYPKKSKRKKLLKLYNQK